MLKIDQYAYINRLSQVHPAEKILLALATMIVCLAFTSPVLYLAVILLMTAVTVVMARIPGRFFLKLMLAPMAFLALSVLTVVFVVAASGYPVLWGVQIGGHVIGVTAAGLIQAGTLFLRAMGAVSCLYFLSLTTPMVELFSTLRALRLPPLFVELMSLIYRYIFVLLETTDRIYTAQATRFGYANLRTSYASLGQLLSSLFVRSYYNAQMLFTALTSRGYTGNLNVLENTYALSRRNLTVIGVVEAALVVIGLWSTGVLHGILHSTMGGAGF